MVAALAIEKLFATLHSSVLLQKKEFLFALKGIRQLRCLPNLHNSSMATEESERSGKGLGEENTNF